MKKLFFTLLALAAVLSAGAQETPEETKGPWTKQGVASVNMSQVSLSNWSAGGDPSIAFDLSLNYNADYEKDNHLWKNVLEMAYGLNKTDANGTRKTNDKIYLNSTYGYKIAPKWYVSAFVTYQSQFDKGYNYNKDQKTYISQFMSPGYLSVGPGLTWKPKEWFSATFSPASWRGTFVLDNELSDQGAFGVDPGKKIKSEFGGNATLEFKKEILANMLLSSRLNLFTDYMGHASHVDVNWDTQLNMKINKWFSANLTVNMIYDHDTKTKEADGTITGPKLQVKQVLGVGLSAHF